MMYTLYNVALYAVALVFSPILLLMMLLNVCNLRQRFGFWNHSCDTPAQDVVWCHAASMGEVTALATVVHELKKTLPQLSIAISTTTMTGQNRARELIPSAACIFLAPLDLHWAVHRVLRRLRPKALILTETELWPNMTVQARRWGCNVGLINGRMSEKSVRRYRPVKGLMKHVLKGFQLVCVQTELDSDRFLVYGARPENTVILGNIKFDMFRFLAALKTSHLTKESLRIAPQSKVIVAGSTRPGEEEVLLSSFSTIKEDQDECVFILAPRHMDRISEVEHILLEHHLEFVKRSSLKTSTRVTSGIILLDTMGELSQIYSLADVAFVGGSLVPLGGHNPLEPAMWGVPVLFGPHRQNIRHITDLLIHEGGGLEIKSRDEFTTTVLQLLKNPDERKKRGEAAHRVVEAHSGVSSRTVRLLREHGIV
ncbi:MAG: 3-deoxy-D-manno-octulosonic acid transferase [Gemmatimonadota bacterium]|nr:MAG: 3-deoxy-D-manno-octulosonic acid transferase [Gemmatimonadota bacterium]